MPRIVSVSLHATQSVGSVPTTPDAAAVAGFTALVQAGLPAGDDFSARSAAERAKLLDAAQKTLAKHGFRLTKTASDVRELSRDGLTIAFAAQPAGLRVSYRVDDKNATFDVGDIALHVPAGTAPSSSAAAKAIGDGSRDVDTRALTKAGFSVDPSSSTFTHPDGSWAVDGERGLVVGFQNARVAPLSAGENVAATSKAKPAAAEAKPAATAVAAKVTTTTATPKEAKPLDKLAGAAMPKSLEPSHAPDGRPQKLEDAAIDSMLFLADNRTASLAQLKKSLPASARQIPMEWNEGWRAEAWRFPDGSQLHFALEDGAPEMRVFVVDHKGQPIDADLDQAATFHLPVTTEAGPASAALDAALLQSPGAIAELQLRGFVQQGDAGRLFAHPDGSWAVIVPSAAGDAPRVAAGVDDRRYALVDGAAVKRDNDFAKLPGWVQQMVRLSPPGQDADLQMFAKQLAALDEGMLRPLAAAGYTLNVTRYRLSNAIHSLRDESVNSGGAGPAMADLAEGVHMAGGSQQPSITVRTYMKDGQLRVDVSTLVHEIGHAFDLVVDANASPKNAVHVRMQRGPAARDPLNVDPEFVAAFTDEHKALPPYFHTQGEFAAESFAMFMLDPVRCKRVLPKAFAFWEKRLSAIKPDPSKVFELELAFDRPAVVTIPEGSADLRKQLAFAAQRDRLSRQAGVPVMPTVALLDAKADFGADAYAADIARAVRASFGKEAGVYRPDENLVRMTPGQAQSAADVTKILDDIETSGRPAVVYVPDASQLNSTSALFTVYEERLQHGRDLPPLVIAGEGSALSGIDSALSTVMRLKGKLDALTGAQQAEVAARIAAQEGFTFEQGAVEALAKKLKGGGYQGAIDAWRSVKTAQFERHLAENDASHVDANANAKSAKGATGAKTATSAKRASGASKGRAQQSLQDVREIKVADVESMKVSTKKSAAERLAEMIGQDEAKRQIDAIVQQARIAQKRAKEGLPDAEPIRLNMLFSGAPGTGKTTFAEIMGQLLQEIGAIKNPQVTKVTIQDLIANPETAVKSLFEKNKGGVIFVDEMHQLKDTAEGKRAFRAMIPYLADPAYQDTVFIGAGYSDELGELIRDVDAGAERRFNTVNFLDYKKDELSSIIDMKVKNLSMTLSPEAKDAALQYLDYRKRVVKHFGNAGEVDNALKEARKAQTLRIAKLPDDKITKRTLMELLPEDFVIPAPITKEEFWAEMDKMSGWDDVKAQLREMGKSIEGAVRRGKQPTDAVEPYWIIDGPPGTGKSTLARMLSMFGAAYGLTAVPEVVDVQGANFQGEFVGQTAGVVRKQFEKSWGRLMFVDEVSGLAQSGGDFKFEAAKIILAETENNRGKFMMVVADYAERVNQFLALDPGLARRFGNRITLSPWTPQQASDDLRKKLAEEGIKIPGLIELVKPFFEVLATMPGYASGGDVRSIKNGIMQVIDALGDVDLEKALPQAIEKAFEILQAMKRANAGPAAKSAAASKAPVQAATKAAAAKDVDEKDVEVRFDDHERKVLSAWDAANQKLAKQLNGLSLEEITRLENDPKSFFAKELGKQLGVKPDEAIKQLVKVRVKVKKLVQKQELIQRFQYHCPYCGRVESSSCAYINYPMEWKLEHSLRKPWTEVKTSTEEVETIEERDV